MHPNYNNSDKRVRPIHPLERDPAPQTHTQQVHQAPERPHVITQETSPWLTYVLLGINILVFLADQVMGRQLTLMGMKSNAAIEAGQYWRLITPIFLHGGIMHLAVNSYFMFRIAPRLEKTFGTPRFAAIYFLSGLGASLFSFVLNPNVPSVGASGALFGIFTAWIPVLYRNKDVMRNTKQAIRSIVEVLGINLLIGLLPGIDNSAHMGGLVTGLVLGWLASPRYHLHYVDATTVRVEDQSEPGIVWFLITLTAIVLGGTTFVLVWL